MTNKKGLAYRSWSEDEQRHCFKYSEGVDSLVCNLKWYPDNHMVRADCLFCVDTIILFS